MLIIICAKLFLRNKIKQPELTEGGNGDAKLD